MGIQINGNTDTISAIDGSLAIQGASGNVTGNLTGNVNSSGVSTFSSGIVVSAGTTEAPSISPLGDSNTGIFFPAADTVAIAEGGVEALRIDNNGRIIFAASTPLTATAGAVEYDGSVIYTTPSGRGVSPSMMSYRLNSGRAGTNASGAQSVFGVGVTLVSNTVYAFEGFYTLQKTAGTTSHTLGILFNSAATLNNIGYIATSVRFDTAGTSGGSGTGTGFTTAVAYNTTTNNVVLTGNITTANATCTILVRGTVSVSAGGVFTPQYQLSATPGGAYTALAGSSFAIWPIGASGSNTSVGPWS